MSSVIYDQNIKIILSDNNNDFRIKSALILSQLLIFESSDTAVQRNVSINLRHRDNITVHELSPLEQ